MPLDFSLDRLTAEIAWWPLGSEYAFYRCTTELSRQAVGVLTPATTDLAAGLKEHLRTQATGSSLESLQQLNNSIWFPPDPVARSFEERYCRHQASTVTGSRDAEVIGMHKYLMGLACDRIDLDGSASRLHTRPHRLLCEEAESWRWFSFALPPNLLIAARAAAAGVAPPSDYVSLGIAPLEHLLDGEPIAEIHLHVGAAIPFEWLWTNLMSRIGNDEAVGQILKGDSFPFGSGKRFLAWLAVAALTRLTLAAFLWRRDCESHDDFSSFMAGRNLCFGGLAEHRQSIAALIYGKSPPQEALTRSLYRRYSGVRTNRKAPDDAEGIRCADPLGLWLGYSAAALPETRFQARSLDYLNRHQDPLFAQAFWQYVRINCRTYRHLTQEPGTAGLDWFHRHFRRISSLRAGLEMEALVSLALDLESRGGTQLSSLEVRTAPSEHWHEIRNMVRQVVKAIGPAQPSHESPPERGLVLHYTKESEVPGLPKKHRRLHADPRSAVYGCRYGAYYYERLRQALAIESALRHHPELLLVLRGMDVCSIELAVPTWVVLPLIDRVRKASQIAAARIATRGLRVPPIQVTLHAGEDYRRLSEGLRRIHEPVEYGLLCDGGRLGHAVALGEDPELWAQKSPVTMQPAEERLDDLLWEMARYRRAELHTDPDRVEYVRSEIERLGNYIYSSRARRLTIEELLQARDLRYSQPTLEWMKYPFMHRCQLPCELMSLLCRYLTEAEVFLRGQEPVEVRADAAERRMLREAQRFIRGRLARLGVTIEANPSSNLLIADLIDLEQHPVFRLQPLPGQPAPEGGTVQVALGDDDPVTFATCLPDEFTHLFFALIRRDVPTQEALTFLDQLRRNGWRSRFTLRWSADDRYQRWVMGTGSLPGSAQCR